MIVTKYKNLTYKIYSVSALVFKALLALIFLLISPRVLAAKGSLVKQETPFFSSVQKNIEMPCFSIQRISFEGNFLIRSLALHKEIAEFEGHCLDVKALNEILKKITHLYVQKGFITSRAYVPQQDIKKTGQLKIAILEGRLEGFLYQEGMGKFLNFGPEVPSTALIVRGDGRWSRKEGIIATAFPSMQGRVINLRDMEQGLDQINRLSSNHATLELKPGKQPGGSFLVIKNQRDRRLRFGLRSNNLGQKNTGLYGLGLSLGFDNLFDLNEAISFSYDRNFPYSPVYFSQHNKRGHWHGSNKLAGSISFAFGNTNLSLSGSYYRYKDDLIRPLAKIDLKGKSWDVGVMLSYLLGRDQTSKTYVSFGFTLKENKNYLLGSLLQTGSRRLAVAQLGFSHVRNLWGGALSCSLGIEQGLKIFNAIKNADPRASGGKGQFNKIKLDMSYEHPVHLGKQQLIYSALISGQWSRDLLFGSEQVGLGGYYTVRGPNQAAFFGNKGGFFRQQLTFPIFFKNEAIKRLSPYVAFDMGAIVGQRSYAIPKAFLGGWSLGLKGESDYINFDLGYSNLGFSKNSLPKGTKRHLLFFTANIGL